MYYSTGTNVVTYGFHRTHAYRSIIIYAFIFIVVCLNFKYILKERTDTRTRYMYMHS